jgi:hypothetical protein
MAVKSVLLTLLISKRVAEKGTCFLPERVNLLCLPLNLQIIVPTIVEGVAG